MIRLPLVFMAGLLAAACVGQPAVQEPTSAPSPAPAVQFSLNEATFQASVAARYPAPLPKETLLADLKSQGIDCTSYVADAFDCQRVIQAGETPCFDVWMVGIDAKDAAKSVLENVGYARRCLGASPG